MLDDIISNIPRLSVVVYSVDDSLNIYLNNGLFLEVNQLLFACDTHIKIIYVTCFYWLIDKYHKIMKG
jgi:hypothetical protein